MPKPNLGSRRAPISLCSSCPSPLSPSLRRRHRWPRTHRWHASVCRRLSRRAAVSLTLFPACTGIEPFLHGGSFFFSFPQSYCSYCFSAWYYFCLCNSRTHDSIRFFFFSTQDIKRLRLRRDGEGGSKGSVWTRRSLCFSCDLTMV
jgi:hypothetical protein